MNKDVCEYEVLFKVAGDVAECMTGCGRVCRLSPFGYEDWKYCPYCGKEIKVKEADDEERL